MGRQEVMGGRWQVAESRQQPCEMQRWEKGKCSRERQEKREERWQCAKASSMSCPPVFSQSASMLQHACACMQQNMQCTTMPAANQIHPA